MPEFIISPMVIAVPVLMFFVLIELVISMLIGKEIYSFQDSITSLNIGILSQFVNATGAVISAFMYAKIEAMYGTFDWSLSSPITWAFALLLYDFLYYWVHRAGHEVNMFWASHITHHSSEQFNLSTALRQASTGFYFKWVFYMPLAILGIPVQVFIVVGLIDLLYQVWVHTRLIGRLGFLEWFLVTPSNHRVHHGTNDYCIDKNYGGIFSIWDRAFNTYEDEREEETIKYGIKKPLNSWNPVWSNLHYWVSMIRMAHHQHSLGAKLLCFFGEPSWSPDQPSNQYLAEENDRNEQFQDQRVPMLAKLSGLIVTIFSTSLLILYLGTRQQLSGAAQLTITACAVFAFMLIGVYWTRSGQKSAVDKNTEASSSPEYFSNVKNSA